ncbi:MAG TPA: DNA mismatch repair endonuclease MutL [Candidatus Uhrbacteria bacterium]|nr:DNA mismatch repair endonuclease MutL [Candidatus Uhrbacteria bacterium]
MIKKLSQDLINKIAAGEVVERPASVVKELIENSIDARATQIVLEIKNGGIDLISLADNGIGIKKEDAELAIERHATSKISSVEDLFNIQTLGFRGEALASIAAVSQFALETKTQKEIEGTSLKIENGKLKIDPCGCPEGTKVIIKELFYNVPARKKFLKSASTEYKQILELFTQFALINPQINFKLINNGKIILNLPQTKDWLERIKQILGSDIAKELIPIGAKGTLQISGFIGKPQIARNNKKAQFIFVNNRAVQDFIIAKAVKEGYGTLIPKELNPTFILNFQMPPELVDVNVHPRKTEVKFLNSQEIYLAALQTVQKALTNNISQEIQITQTGLTSRKFILKPRVSNPSYQPTVSYQPTFKNIRSQPSTVSQAIKFSQEVLKNNFTAQPQKQIGDWRLLGQIHNSYLLVEAPQGILIIDQHAAAERILYEKFKKSYKTEKIKSQRLLLPLNLELSASENEILKQSLNFLQGLGFDIEIFGNKAFIINAVPQELDKLDIKQTILGIINDLEDQDFSRAKSLEEKKDLVIKYAACRTAIKFNDKIAIEEQTKLLEDILNIIDKINTCPHGRPFVMELTLDQLAKNFKRK